CSFYLGRWPRRIGGQQTGSGASRNATLQQVAHLILFVFRTTMARLLLGLGFLLALGPALLHHCGDSLACSRTHVAPRVFGHSFTAHRSSSTTARAKSFQRGNGSINTLTLSLKVS